MNHSGTPISAWNPRVQEQIAAQLHGKNLEPVIQPLTPAEFIAMIDVELSRSEETFVIDVDPMGAPRMTQRDQWYKRPVTGRYWKFKAKLKLVVGAPPVPDELHCLFEVPMPSSWSKKKKAAMKGKPHRQRPDVDNICKGCADSLWDEDSAIWKMAGEKRWSTVGKITLRLVWLAK